MGEITTQGTSTTTTPQETGPPKRPIIHIGGPRKKAKAQKYILEYTIIKDDVDLVTERVQDHTAEEYEEAENQTKRTRKDLADIK